MARIIADCRRAFDCTIIIPHFLGINMSNNDWQAISIILTLLGAFLSLVGGIKAKGLTPDSAPNVRNLVNSLEPFLRSQASLLREVLKQMKTPQGNVSTLASSTIVAIEIAEERTQGALDTIPAALSNIDAASVAAGARVWMCLGAATAMLAAAIQMYLLPR